MSSLKQIQAERTLLKPFKHNCHLNVLLNLHGLKSSEKHVRRQLWSQLLSGGWQVFDSVMQTQDSEKFTQCSLGNPELNKL